MNISRRSMLLLGGLGALALARCAGTPIGPSGLTVTASISAATLADDCAAREAPSTGLVAGDCAPSESGDSRYCGGFCRQSNVQIRYEASAGEGSAATEIVSVRLLDAESGEARQTLTARNPQRWDGSAYVAWDQRVAAGATVQASYDLSAPDWSRVGGDSTGRFAYTRRYIIEVVVRIDGVERTLRSGEVTREPEVVT